MMASNLERRLRELERCAPAPDFSRLTDAALLDAIAGELSAIDPSHGPAILRAAARVNAGEAALAVNWPVDDENLAERVAAALLAIGTA